MRIIKLNAIDSTNTFLRQLSSAEPMDDYTIVIADHQTKGKGQMGSKWIVEGGKNLMFSVLKKVSFVFPDEKFGISVVASLSVMQALKHFDIPKISIKWPNDILAENKKICGILIENVIQNGVLASSIIGIGLNVNQVNFENLPQASSLLNMTGKAFHRDEIMHAIVAALQDNFKRLEAGELQTLMQDYQTHLFRKDKPSTFRDLEGNLFSGYIKGITQEGKLNVLLEDDVMKEFDLKELKLLY